MTADILSDLSGRGDPGFRAVHEWGAYVMATAIDKPRFYFRDTTFRGSSHPFFRTVYEFAAEINKGYADLLDAAVAM